MQQINLETSIEIMRIISDNPSLKLFRDDLKNKVFHHAYLFAGTDKFILRYILKLAAMISYCDNGGCFSCAECRKVLNDYHSDIEYLLDNDGKDILVDDIAPILKDKNVAAMDNKHRLYVIEGLERMNNVCQNRLLKTFEEPIESLHFLMSTTIPKKLLPTIISRVKQFAVPSLNKSQCLAILKLLGISDTNALEATELANCNLSQALFILDSDLYINTLNFLLDFLKNADKEEDILELMRSEYFDAKHFSDTLDIFADILHNVSVSENEGLVFLKQKQDDLLCIRQMLGNGIFLLMDEIDLAKRKLERNIQPNRIIDSLFSKVLEVKNANSSGN